MNLAINFNIQQQEMSNWCWAAVATSVFKYFKPASSITQRRLVSDYLKMPQCTNYSPTCNLRAGLSETLHWLTMYNGRVDSPASPAKIVEELRLNNPLCCLLMHPQYSGHFVVVSALFQDPHNPARLTLRVEDPSDGM